MPTPQRIQDAISRICNQASFIQELLIEALDWPVNEQVEALDDIAYGWTTAELRAEGLDKHLVEGQIWQLQPMQNDQPWGIFLLEFKHHEVFTTGRGLTGPLRKVLRGLVPSRRKHSNLASWKREHLLFICTEGYQHYRFAYFKAPPEGTKTAPLAAFGWDPEVPARTACEFNLPQLIWPDDDISPDEWVSQWASAFDVEKVTKRFYQDYREVFEQTEGLIGKESGLKNDDLRMFTQTLFNRLMFLRFIERKGWLEFNRQYTYLREIHKAGGIGKKSLYQSRISPLFFEGLAVEGKQHSEAIGRVPFLNGGLFEETELDRKIKDIPDTAFDPIIGPHGLFYRYNFTIEESTPLDIEVAVDPEMLGKVFEELVTGRHESGSYYTPRPVVAFMCREALKGHLSDQTNASPEAIASLIDQREVSGLDIRHARKILAALDEIKAVDPACGSGAYLLGLLHEMIAIYRALYNEKLLKDSRTISDLKLRIITNSLYGVDIDPFATNIAMLRLWLSIAVEAEEPLPLPNLDFKIETGDSVLGPNPSGDVHEDAAGAYKDIYREQLVKKFSDLKDSHVKSYSPDEKQQLKELIDELRLQIAEGVHPGEPALGFDWRVEFAEVWQSRGGFDIVLANPPYIRQELIRHIKPALKAAHPEFYCGTADLYCYFYARGLQLLHKGGMLSFISSNKWFRAAYGKNLRKRIADTCSVKSITDFGELPVFETAATFPMIFVAQKGKGNETPMFSQVKSLAPPYPDVLAIMKAIGQRLPVNALNGTEWRLIDAKSASRLRKMEKAGVPLREYVNGEIYRGVLTGLNTAFVIDGKKRKELIAEDPRSAEIIKPLAVGNDVRRWRIERQNKWLIVTKIGIPIKRYPAVFNHLKQWKDELKNRRDQGNHWWELRACAYYDDFEKPKILLPDIAKESRFTFDTENVYFGNTAYMIPVDDLYLLAVLNSEAVWDFIKATFQCLGDPERGGRVRLIYQSLTTIPIPNAPLAIRKNISRLVEKCLAAKGADCDKWEKEINERVAALYGL